MLQRIFPFLKWFPVSADVLKADFIAGLTVSLVLIPQSMAYAELAGLPPWIGLYASFVPVIIGALWGFSNHLQTGPVAMGSLITGSTLLALAVPGSDNYLLLASQLAVTVGIIRLVIALLKLTFIVNFLSRPVIGGFIHAGVLIIATSQFAKILGIRLESGGHYLSSLWNILERLNTTNSVSLYLGLSSLAVLLVGKKVFPRVPIALIVMVIATSIVCLFGLSDPERVSTPITIVGAIPAGIPRYVGAMPSWSNFLTLLPGACAIAFVGFMEMCSVVKAVAVQSRQRIDLDQETLGQGLAAIGSGFSGAYSVSGSLSRTALNYAVGAKSSLSAVFTGCFVLVFLLFFTQFLYYLPKATLSAIIIAAVLQLVHLKRFAHYFKVSKGDGLAGLFTFVATLAFAPHLEYGVCFGVVLSVAMYLYRTMKPHVALLGRHPDGSLRDAEAHGLELDGDMPIVRFDGRLYFANVSYFEDTIRELCQRFPQAKYIAIGCSGVNAIDASGEEMLRDLCAQLKESGVELLFIRMKHQVFDVLERSGFVQEFGKDRMFRSLDEAKNAIGVSSSVSPQEP